LTSFAAQPGESFAEFTDDGGWCWFADPRAVSHGGNTFAGWVTEDGSIQVGAFDEKSSTVQVATLHAKLERDDHDNPGLLVLPDGRLLAIYSEHCGHDMLARTTKKPGDISEWNAEQVLDLAGGPRAAKNITYANPFILSDEPGAISMLWRGDTWKPTFSKSFDNGKTWTPGKPLVARPGAGNDNRPYAKYVSNGKDTIHIVFTDGHPRNEALNNVYHACLRGGVFYKADGSRICSVDELPFAPSQADLVYDAHKSGARAWIWDMALDEKGNPVIAYTRLPSETNHIYACARWDGKVWQDHEIAPGGKWFPQTPAGKTEPEPHYSSGFCLDHANPSVAYLTRPVNGVREVERWQTSDGGATWKSSAITTNSQHDNIRPFVSWNGSLLCWLNVSGHYRHFTDYRTSVKMAVTTPVKIISLTNAASAEKLAPLSAELKPAAILTAMERVADWQLAHPGAHKLTDWTQGAFYAGAMALARVSERPRFTEAMRTVGAATHWQPGARTYHADDQCVGQMYVEMWELYHDAAMLAPLRESFDKVLAAPHDGDLDFKTKGVQDRWSWCDSLFMSPPAWARLARATGEQKYLDFAVTNWWRTTEFLYDKDEHLFFRDSTYFAKREANGKKVFWSRGNGWVIAGLARLLDYLPEQHADRARFEKLFREMADKILSLQQPDGLWRSSLLDAENYPLQETSGSGFYCYALAWGVNRGLLDRAKFSTAIAKSWAALVQCVDADGKLTHVQPIGADPKHFAADATEVYGVGAFLLAGSEVYRLNQPKP
jgi:rhamnogalacturonyl hydrolase YesR